MSKITEIPEGWEFCGVMDATHTIDTEGEIHPFSAMECCQRVRKMYPDEKSPLSVVADANIRLGCKSIRRIAR